MLASLWLFIFLPDARTRLLTELKLQRAWVGLVGLLSGLSVFFLMKAYQVGEASLVRPVYHTSLVFSVLAGILFLKERDKPRQKMLGAAVAFSGVVLLRLV